MGTLRTDAAQVSPPYRGRFAGWSVLALALGLAGCGNQPLEQISPVLSGASPERGRTAIAARGCGTCHMIAGVPGARGRVGPPLDTVARREYLAGLLPNSPENMMRWIVDPQGISPRTVMPSMGIDESEARDITAYLYALPK